MAYCIVRFVVFASMNSNLEVREVWSSGLLDGSWLSSADAGIITLGYLLVPGEAMLGAFSKLRKATVGFVVSARPSSWNPGRVCMKFDIWGIFGKTKSVETIQVPLKYDMKAHEHVTIVSRRIHLRMRNAAD